MRLSTFVTTVRATHHSSAIASSTSRRAPATRGDRGEDAGEHRERDEDHELHDRDAQLRHAL